MNGPTARGLKAANITPLVSNDPFWYWVKANCEIEMAMYDLLEKSARDKAKEFPDAPYV